MRVYEWRKGNSRPSILVLAGTDYFLNRWLRGLCEGMDSVSEWRWMLVDALADGRKFWPCRLHLSEPGSFGQMMLEIEEAQKSGDLERMKMTLANCEKRMPAYKNLDPEQARFALQCPRFFMDSPYIKSEIPFETWQEYARGLPALAIPFHEFWFEWEWDYGEQLVAFAANIKTEYEPHKPCTMHLEIFLDIPPKNIEIGKQTVMMITGTVEIDENRKVVSVNTHESDIILFLPVLHSLALLNCKNVITTEITVPRQMKRQIMRKHGIEMCAYRVVKIMHTKRRTRRQIEEGEEAEQDHTSRPLSICRGHFKTYDEKGLFGRRFGTYWWQDYVRGDEQQGIVVKDYAMSK